MPGYAKLKSLVDVPAGSKKAMAREINKAVRGLATALEKERAAGRFRVVMLGKAKETTFNVDHGGAKSKVTSGAEGKANFEICGSEETLAEIAAGRLSPVDAYLTGRLQVRGDLEYGKRVYARVAAPGRRDI